MNTTRLVPALIIGAVLAAVGIGLFLLLWNSFAGVGELPRIILALCIPPALMGVGVGGYVLVRGGRNSTS